MTLHIQKLLYFFIEGKIQQYNVHFKNLTRVKKKQIFNENPRTPYKTEK